MHEESSSMETEKRQVQLHFPLDRIAEPVVTELVRQFDLEPNLLRADVNSSTGGWMVVELTGPLERVHSAIEWLKGQGLVVTDIPEA